MFILCYRIRLIRGWEGGKHLCFAIGKNTEENLTHPPSPFFSRIGSGSTLQFHNMPMSSRADLGWVRPSSLMLSFALFCLFVLSCVLAFWICSRLFTTFQKFRKFEASEWEQLWSINLRWNTLLSKKLLVFIHWYLLLFRWVPPLGFSGVTGYPNPKP